MHKSVKLLSMTAVAAALVATSACAAGSYADPGSPSASSSSAAKPSASAKASTSPSVKPSAGKPVPVKEGTPSAILASTPWETTSAKDAKGASVPLTDAKVANYTGFAYYKKDGTFTFYTPELKVKGKGYWTVSPNGKTRTLTALNADGSVQYKRTVDILTLTEKEFTYRVYPEATNKAVYYDVAHKPTTQAQPTA